jgi:hypothetical protein
VRTTSSSSMPYSKHRASNSSSAANRCEVHVCSTYNFPRFCMEQPEPESRTVVPSKQLEELGARYTNDWHRFLKLVYSLSEGYVCFIAQEKVLTKVTLSDSAARNERVNGDQSSKERHCNCYITYATGGIVLYAWLYLVARNAWFDCSAPRLRRSVSIPVW